MQRTIRRTLDCVCQLRRVLFQNLRLGVLLTFCPGPGGQLGEPGKSGGHVHMQVYVYVGGHVHVHDHGGGRVGRHGVWNVERRVRTR